MLWESMVGSVRSRRKVKGGGEKEGGSRRRLYIL